MRKGSPKSGALQIRIQVYFPMQTLHFKIYFVYLPAIPNESTLLSGAMPTSADSLNTIGIAKSVEAMKIEPPTKMTVDKQSTN